MTSTVTRASLPEFTMRATVWRCHVVREDGAGDGAAAYEWRSACGALAAGRSGATFWSTCHGQPVRSQARSLMTAMDAAIDAAERRRAA